MTLGIRPEHIDLAKSDGIPAQVQAVEHLGSQSYLHLTIASGEPLTMIVDGETEVGPDQQVQIEMNSRFLHLFDRNGNAVRDESQQT